MSTRLLPGFIALFLVNAVATAQSCPPTDFTVSGAVDLDEDGLDDLCFLLDTEPPHAAPSGYFQFSWSGGCLATTLAFDGQSLDLRPYGFTESFLFYGFEPGACQQFAVTFIDGTVRVSDPVCTGCPADDCGNGTCDPGETWVTCPADCPVVCSELMTVMPSEDLDNQGGLDVCISGLGYLTLNLLQGGPGGNDLYCDCQVAAYSVDGGPLVEVGPSPLCRHRISLLPPGECVDLYVEFTDGSSTLVEDACNDCGTPVVCGDGLCMSGEDANNCGTDCFFVNCGDGLCDLQETAENCHLDCGMSPCTATMRVTGAVDLDGDGTVDRCRPDTDQPYLSVEWEGGCAADYLTLWAPDYNLGVPLTMNLSGWGYTDGIFIDDLPFSQCLYVTVGFAGGKAAQGYACTTCSVEAGCPVQVLEVTTNTFDWDGDGLEDACRIGDAGVEEGYVFFDWDGPCLATELTWYPAGGQPSTFDLASSGLYTSGAFIGLEPGSCHDFDLTFADGSTRSTGEVCVACGAVPDCPGDATGDAVVDGQDLAAVLAAWGADVPDVDQNADGTIDGQDLAAVLAAWGLPCGQ
ncbi:MAG: hypothetical protein VXX30_06380 [Planctomycetota bacterium]|nr:hypothetical protein [Planctomycetota bacterium]